jgi:hypothetical protein
MKVGWEALCFWHARWQDVREILDARDELNQRGTHRSRRVSEVIFQKATRRKLHSAVEHESAEYHEADRRLRLVASSWGYELSALDVLDMLDYLLQSPDWQTQHGTRPTTRCAACCASKLIS